jgi:hypothetical protein
VEIEMKAREMFADRSRKLFFAAIFLWAALLPRLAWAAITFVQSTAQLSSSNAQSLTSASFGTNPVVGNVIIVVAWTYNNGGAPTVTASDNKGNTYTSVAQQNVFQSGAGYQNAAILWAPVTSTGAGFKVTISSALTGSQIEGIAVEYSGIGAVDQTNAVTGTSSTPTIATTASTTTANELVASVLGILLPSKTFTSINPAAGYSAAAVQLDNVNATGGEAAGKSVAATGVQSNTWTISPSTGTWAWAAAIATFGPLVSASKSTVTASPNAVPADNVSTTTITVTLKDSDGNPIAGKTVTLAQIGSSTISAASGPSNASGVVTFTAKSAVAQRMQYTATDATDGIVITQRSLVNFGPSAAASTVVASPTSVPADNVTTSTITVTLRDAAGNPVANKSVLIAAGSGSSTRSPIGGTSNASGVMTSTVRDAIVESVTYSAYDTTDSLTIGQTATVSFTPVVASFNVVEPAADAVAGKIFTKIAGQNFALDVVARTAANAVATGFTGTVAVEVVDNSGGGACNTLPVIATFTNQVFAGGDAGRHVLTSPNTVADVYRNALVRVKFPTSSPTVVSCSSDNFAIRPATLGFLVQDANRTTAGTTNTLNNTALPGTPATVHNAGRPFTITATGFNGAASPAITSNYTGAPFAVLTPCAGTACTATTGNLTACVDVACSSTTGNLSLAAWTASGGTVSLTTATYDDVGAFTLQLQDATFAAVDAADGTSAAQLTISSTATGVGRFVPDRFLLSAASLVPRSDIAACAGSSFTYMGERIDAKFTLTAVKFPSGTTARYTGTLGRLALSNPASFNFGAIDSAGPTVLGARLDTSLGSSGAWSNGVGAVVAVVAVNRNASPDGPFSSLKLGIAPSDPDAVALEPAAINLDADNNGSGERAQIGAATDVRFGRLRLQNANGSSAIAMPIPISVQYWNGTGFVTNTLDSCTSFTAANVAVGNPQPLGFSIGAPTVGGTFSAGIGTLSLPASGARGSVDVSLNLTAGSTGASCTAGLPASTGTARGYLQGAWCGATYVNDPTAHATFGIYRNSDKFIYQRENY